MRISIVHLTFQSTIFCKLCIFNSQGDDWKSKLDPLVKMNTFLNQTKRSESQKEEKRKKEKKRHQVCKFVRNLYAVNRNLPILNFFPFN